MRKFEGSHQLNTQIKAHKSKHTTPHKSKHTTPHKSKPTTPHKSKHTTPHKSKHIYPMANRIEAKEGECTAIGGDCSVWMMHPTDDEDFEPDSLEARIDQQTIVETFGPRPYAIIADPDHSHSDECPCEFCTISREHTPPGICKAVDCALPRAIQYADGTPIPPYARHYCDVCTTKAIDRGMCDFCYAILDAEGRCEGRQFV